MELRLDPVPDPATQTLHAVGHIGLQDMEALETTLEGIVRTSGIKGLVLDCSALEAWDDAAISSVVNFVRTMTHDDRRVAVYGLNADLQANLDRLGISDFLYNHDSRDAALQAVQPG